MPIEPLRGHLDENGIKMNPHKWEITDKINEIIAAVNKIYEVLPKKDTTEPK